jgi:hypothetical protein
MSKRGPSLKKNQRETARRYEQALDQRHQQRIAKGIIKPVKFGEQVPCPSK